MKHMKEACLMVWFYATDRMRRRISSVQLYPVKHCTEFKPGV
nr:hypothetical protein [uncultured Lachnoclostridium sp.]